MSHFIGVDLGGTYIKAIAISKSGEVLVMRKYPTEVHLGKEEVINKIVSISDEISTELSGNVTSVGVTMPGVINLEKGTVELLPNFPDDWKGYPLIKILNERIQQPVVILNDARAATYAEKKFGVAQNFNNFVSIIIGTGVGGGVIHNGELLLGSRGGAGEIGHQVVNPNGIVCGCGNVGCLETVASGPAIASAAYRYIKQGFSTLMYEMIEQDLNKITPKMVDNAASLGDETAIKILKTVASNISQVVLNMKAILNPEAIIFGGGVGQSELLIEMVRQNLDEKQILFPDSVGHTEILQSKFSDLSGAIGVAAWAIHVHDKTT